MRDQWTELLEALAAALAGRRRAYGTATGAGAERMRAAPDEGPYEAAREMTSGAAGYRREGGAAAGELRRSGGAEDRLLPALRPAAEEGASDGGEGGPFPLNGRSALPLLTRRNGEMEAPALPPTVRQGRRPVGSGPAGGIAGLDGAFFFEETEGETGGADVEALDRAFQRDARRYDGGFSLY